MNNTDRFTGKARAYAQGRPDYPASVVGLLTQESRRENPRLADIGSGTGILSRAMLERGWTVYGVEPNDDMRREAERRSMHQTSRISPRAMAPASLHL